MRKSIETRSLPEGYGRTTGRLELLLDMRRELRHARAGAVGHVLHAEGLDLLHVVLAFEDLEVDLLVVHLCANQPVRP